MKNAIRSCLLLLLIIAPGLLGAEPEGGRARVAIFEPSGSRADATLSAILATVTDTIELGLACLDRYSVRRLPPTDPLGEYEKVRAYCAENHIDQAIGGNPARRERRYSLTGSRGG